MEQIFDTSIKNVWDSITIVNKMKKWFFKQITSFEPKVGFETSFIVKVDDRIFPHLWKLTEVVQMKKIVYDWRYDGYEGRVNVVFELFENDNKTLLRLTNSVVEDFSDNVPEFKRKSGLEGWKFFIQNSLKQYLKENEE
ncbi:MAG: SRPBCC domain-containing protein [Bacteroidales bacterium]|nr:SRPBCC domain-containing protein [Bacteroidales bacterium]